MEEGSSSSNSASGNEVENGSSNGGGEPTGISWQKCTDPATGRTFYYDPVTRSSCWTLPDSSTALATNVSERNASSKSSLVPATKVASDDMSNQIVKSRSLSNPVLTWVECFHKVHNCKYYYDKVNKVSVWEKPKEGIIITEEEAQRDAALAASTASASAATAASGSSHENQNQAQNDEPASVAVKKYRDFLDQSSKAKQVSKYQTWSEGDEAAKANGAESANEEGEWIRTLDPATGHFYLYNPKSRVKVEETPSSAAANEMAKESNGDDGADDVDDWEKHIDDASGKAYMYSKSRKQSKWALNRN